MYLKSPISQFNAQESRTPTGIPWAFLFALKVLANLRYRQKEHGFFMPANNIEDIHIGQMIRAELKAQGRTMKWFSEAIHRDYSVVHKMLKRESIDLAMLVRISKLLNHDFLRDISEAMAIT